MSFIVAIIFGMHNASKYSIMKIIVYGSTLQVVEHPTEIHFFKKTINVLCSWLIISHFPDRGDKIYLYNTFIHTHKLPYNHSVLSKNQ